jgi:hypothetical protein
MWLAQALAAMANIEAAHFAPDTAGIEAATAADAAAAGDLCEQRIAPLRQALRGERPQLAATCA